LKLHLIPARRSFWLAILLVALLPLPLPGAGRAAAVPSPEPRAPDYQLLVNSSLEEYDPPYGQYEGVDCQVASGWQRFWYGGPEPYWMDCLVFADSSLGTGWVEAIDGDTSQMIISTEPYTAGLRQQVGGLTPGVSYGFHAALVTIYQTSDQEPVHGTMIKEVGIDPTGGTDPLSPDVVWSEPNGQDHGWDVTRITAATARSSTVTAFIRITSPHPSGGLPLLNQSFLDSAILAQTAQVSASSPGASGTESFQVRWDNAVPSPGATVVRYDVQWLDEAEGMWHDWLTWTTKLSATFDGQWGHHYRFRARAWQRYPNGAHLFSPYRAEGDTQTRVGIELAGRVLDPWGRAAPGATVVISETGYTAVSGAGGGLIMNPAPWPEPVSLVVSHPYWLSPPPVYGLSLTPTATLALTWTMRPPGDAVINGDFEAGLEGWSAAPGATLTDVVHTGHGAAALAAGPETRLASAPGLSRVHFKFVGSRARLGPVLTASSQLPTEPKYTPLSQTLVLTDAWQPALSFWYMAPDAGGEPLFDLVLTVITRTVASTPVTTTLVLTPPLPTGGWRHFWSYAGAPHAALSGTVTVAFRPWAGAVYLDEVRLGATPGGPWCAYLPLLTRQY
jgi:hypothetical protein